LARTVVKKRPVGVGAPGIPTATGSRRTVRSSSNTVSRRAVRSIRIR
jgi:hypothetical protein